MKITKYGHSCLLVQVEGVKILVDPGGFSDGFEDVTGIAAVLYTHQHADHYDADKLVALKLANPDARIIADAGTADIIKAAGYEVETVAGGSNFEVGGVVIEGIGDEHAQIHPSIPGITNVGYLIAGKLFHPGDAFTLPPVPVEILALPLVAPWSKVGETADYLTAVRPQQAFPIHDAIASMPQMYLNIISGITKGQETKLIPLPSGESIEV